MRATLLPLLTLSLAAQAPRETPTTLKDQQALAVTIYNADLALVKDQREVRLPKGDVQLAFQEVSAQIRPETALLRNLTESKGFWVIEQNFDFDLLTPTKLLEKYVGQKVTVVRQVPNPDGAGAKELREEATVLATNQGVVLQFADRIETSAPGRLVYPRVPENLRARPTLVLSLHSPAEKAQKLELSYLTGGLSWKADYVANLSSDERTLDLNGWVTLTNQSGAAYPDATLQLVAGDVNRVQDRREADQVRQFMAKAKNGAAEMQEESLFEYHLYTLDRPTTLKENQTKQVALLAATSVPVLKEYLLQGQGHYYTQSVGGVGEKLKIGVFVQFDNKDHLPGVANRTGREAGPKGEGQEGPSHSANLGKPMPKGVVRVYKKDRDGRAQFVGEDAIDHTPKHEQVRLKLGEAFDITARRKQTDFKKVSGSGKYNYVYDAAFEVELKNAKPEAVTVTVREPVPGDWELLEQSHPSTKEASGTATFKVPVPAEGSAKLTYKVRVKW